MAGESGALESAPLSTGSVGSVERPFVVGGEVVEVVVMAREVGVRGSCCWRERASAADISCGPAFFGGMTTSRHC